MQRLFTIKIYKNYFIKSVKISQRYSKIQLTPFNLAARCTLSFIVEYCVHGSKMSHVRHSKLVVLINCTACNKYKHEKLTE